MKPRIRVRAAINTAQPEAEYHGASGGRRLAGFGVQNTGANAALNGKLPTLRNRSRHAYRNSPLVKQAIRSNVRNEVGTGAIARFRSDDLNFNENMRLLFDAFAKECDADGLLDLYGLQALAVKSRRISGEVFIRKRRRSLTSGLTIPFQLQMLEADFVPANFNDVRGNGNKITAGIERNRIGQRVAYWMYKEHPGESTALSGMISYSDLIRVPAKDVIHMFLPERPGQMRGEPDATAALVKVKTYDSYDDAELQRKEARSGYTGMIVRRELDDEDFNFDPISGRPRFEDSEDNESEQIKPGTFVTGLPGEDLKLFDGDNTGSGYKDFTREQKLMISAAFDSPFELTTGDWSGVNDRIYRAFIQEYRRGIEMLQDHVLIYQFLRRTVDWVVSAAIEMGKVKAKGYAKNKNNFHRVEWRPHAWKHIHPVQDIEAQVLAIDNKLNSRDAIIAEMGYDGEEIDKQINEAEARYRRLKQEYGNSEENPKEEPDQDQDGDETDN